MARPPRVHALHVAVYHVAEVSHHIKGKPTPTTLYCSASRKIYCNVCRMLRKQEKIKTLWSLATSDGEGCDVEAFLSKETFLSIMVGARNP